jgi:hypothetical protein
MFLYYVLTWIANLGITWIANLGHSYSQECLQEEVEGIATMAEVDT